MSLLLLFAGAPSSGVVVTPPPPVEQGGPTARSVRQVQQWQQKWEDEEFATALAALLLI